MNVKLTNKVKRIRQAANLDSDLWLRVPDDLILLAFIGSDRAIPVPLRDQLRRQYQSTNYEEFEWFGDAILELIISQYLLETEPNLTHGQLDKFRKLIVRNLTLYCFMNRKDLCREIIGRTLTMKRCA